MKPLLGITMSDPAGIGAEIIVKALARPAVQELCRPLVIGDLEAMLRTVREITHLNLAAEACTPDTIPEARDFHPKRLNVLNLGNIDPIAMEYGKVSAGCGRAGISYPGYIEICASLTGTRDYAMMLVEGDFRVAHVSAHVSLREIAAAGGQFDAAVAMYHDQGHIPVKMKGFLWDGRRNRWSSVRGINVTLGLPIVRTSVDHGVAFDIAGTGAASEESMVAAIELAAALAAGSSDS